MAVVSSVLTYDDFTLFFPLCQVCLSFVILFHICVFSIAFCLKYVHTSLLLSFVFVSFVTFQPLYLSFRLFQMCIFFVLILRYFCLCVCLLHILVLKPMCLSLLLSQVCISFINSVSSLCIYPLACAYFFTSISSPSILCYFCL